jgi:2Fe-2S ferredoxin
VPEITYVEHNGTRHVVDVPVGVNLMTGALNHLIPGIEGDCGGLCACGTCHVYISPEAALSCGEPDELESGMLEFAFDTDKRSRLACQIEVTPSMEGMTVEMPTRQY